MAVRSTLGAGGQAAISSAATATLTPEQRASAQAKAAHVQAVKKKGCFGVVLLGGVVTLAAAAAAYARIL